MRLIHGVAPRGFKKYIANNLILQQEQNDKAKLEEEYQETCEETRILLENRTMFKFKINSMVQLELILRVLVERFNCYDSTHNNGTFCSYFVNKDKYIINGNIELYNRLDAVEINMGIFNPTLLSCSN